MKAAIQYKRLADTILMVRPYDFTYNEQTGLDNEFQQRPVCGVDNVNAKAMAEFANMVDILRSRDVKVTILEKGRGRETPDAVFPNNWFSTEHDGTLIFYPMLTENRRAEKRVVDVEDLLIKEGFHIRNLINIGRYSQPIRILEGTGSMIIDHDNEIVYAAESQRCERSQFEDFLHARRYCEGILFQTRGSSGKVIYHTNVMMSIGRSLAVICLACIPSQRQRDQITSRLGTSHEIVDISMEQMEKSFCGNILQIRNRKDKSLIVMSERAYQGFTGEQHERLAKHGEALPIPIPTIEEVGGGSVRCMMAEVFLPRVPK